MFQAERYDKILDILQKKKTVPIESLCKQTYCSVATMRRDLIALEKARLITRRRGCASIAGSANTEYSYTFRDTEHKAQKEYICSIAENFISDGLSIFLDSSSTAFPICNLLEKYKNISVVTNGIATAFSLAQSGFANAYITGGQIKNGSAAIIGEFSSDFIKNFKADIAIISCRGIDAEGVYEAALEQALVKQQMLANAKSAILLCDSSKFGNSSFYKLCDFNKLEAIISNCAPTADILAQMSAVGCEVLF